MTATDWFLLSHKRFSQVSQKASERFLISLPRALILLVEVGLHCPFQCNAMECRYHLAHRGFVQGCPEGRDSVRLQVPQRLCWWKPRTLQMLI